MSQAFRAGILKINEIFFSIQGESDAMGWPTVFVRTTGCNIRCNYCDTKYSYTEGRDMTFDEIFSEISKHKVMRVCVTGGEPLAQPSVIDFMKKLCDLGYQTSLETNGFYDVSKVDARVMKVVDIKTPGSDEGNSFKFENLKFMNRQDQIKFVVCGEEDYDWVKSIIKNHALEKLCAVLLSPEAGKVSPKFLAEKILSDFLPVRLQLQLHKYIWDPNARGV